jgi:hypothetical protein
MFHSEVIFDNARSGRPLAPAGDMTLRLRYEVDNPRRLARHVHLVDGVGYFFFPGGGVTGGPAARLLVDFTSTDQTALLDGTVWARPAGGGLWLELPGAGRSLEKLEGVLLRGEPRWGSEQLVLAEGEDRSAILCRTHDVSERGARFTAGPADLGGPGDRIRVALPEAGPSGVQLEAHGCIAWVGDAEVGVEWSAGNLASRLAVRRIVLIAQQQWEGARTISHPRSCRCTPRQDGGLPEVLLLG